jgi:hypothetical protein
VEIRATERIRLEVAGSDTFASLLPGSVNLFQSRDDLTGFYAVDLGTVVVFDGNGVDHYVSVDPAGVYVKGRCGNAETAVGVTTLVVRLQCQCSLLHVLWARNGTAGLASGDRCDGGAGGQPEVPQCPRRHLRHERRGLRGRPKGRPGPEERRHRGGKHGVLRPCLWWGAEGLAIVTPCMSCLSPVDCLSALHTGVQRGWAVALSCDAVPARAVVVMRPAE